MNKIYLNTLTLEEIFNYLYNKNKSIFFDDDKLVEIKVYNNILCELFYYPGNKRILKDLIFNVAIFPKSIPNGYFIID